MSLWKFLRSLPERRRARAEAEAACRSHRPTEPIRASAICADEGHRYIVRVFVGQRTPDPAQLRLPPWRECIIVAVPRDGGAPHVLIDAAEYEPRLR